jgi:hypothetical protein
MKIEAGKYYKTREGRKVFVSHRCTNPFGLIGSEPDFPLEGYMSNGDRDRLSWRDDGTYNYAGEHMNDILAEWKEPKVHKRWVAWWEYKTNPTVPFVVIYNSEDEARKNLESYKDTIVYLHGQEVTYTED